MIKIVALNSKYVHTLLSPYYLKENCDFKDKIQIVQSNINLSIEDIYALAMENNPKVIALPCYIFNINCVVELSKLIKKRNPQTKHIYQTFVKIYNCILSHFLQFINVLM